MLDYKYDQNANTVSFTFSGHMDSARCMPIAPEIENNLTEQLKNPAPAGKPLKVIFNLKEVDFISSAFIRICMVVAGKVKAGNLVIQNAAPLIKKTIKISGLENELTVL